MATFNCPYCEAYALDMFVNPENDEDFYFKCLNPECASNNLEDVNS